MEVDNPASSSTVVPLHYLQCVSPQWFPLGCVTAAVASVYMRDILMGEFGLPASCLLHAESRADFGGCGGTIHFDDEFSKHLCLAFLVSERDPVI